MCKHTSHLNRQRNLLRAAAAAHCSVLRPPRQSPARPERPAEDGRSEAPQHARPSCQGATPAHTHTHARARARTHTHTHTRTHTHTQKKNIGNHTHTPHNTHTNPPPPRPPPTHTPHTVCHTTRTRARALVPNPRTIAHTTAQRHHDVGQPELGDERTCQRRLRRGIRQSLVRASRRVAHVVAWYPPFQRYCCLIQATAL
jgi:hypothetical protein